MKIDKWPTFLESLATDQAALALVEGGDAKKVAELARMRGFDFSEVEIADALSLGAKSGALGDQILDSVSGGSFRF